MIVLQVVAITGEVVGGTVLLLAPELTSKAGAAILYLDAIDRTRTLLKGEGYYEAGLKKIYGPDNPAIGASVLIKDLGVAPLAAASVVPGAQTIRVSELPAATKNFFASFGKNKPCQIRVTVQGVDAAENVGARAMFPEYMQFRAQGFSPAQAKYLAEPYQGMGHHFIPRRFPLPDVIIENPANIMGRGMSRGAFYERHFLGDPYFYGTAFPRSIGGNWSGQSLGLVKLMSPINWWYSAPDWLRATGAAGAAGGGGAVVYYIWEGQ
jgi:hypothetical protein